MTDFSQVYDSTSTRSAGTRLLQIAVAFLLSLALLLSLAPRAQAQSTCGESYTVVYLDTLNQIAERCGTSVAEILELNPEISNPNRIRVGQVLDMPTGSDDSDSVMDPGDSETTFEYRVQRGDWLSRIAERFDTSVSAILAVNPNLSNPNRIYVGQRLMIPGSSEGRQEASLFILPSGGPAGTEVEVRISNFPANVPVELGVGRVNSEYDPITTVRTDGNGNLVTALTIPDFANPGESWVVVATAETDSEVEEISNRFAVGTGEEAVSIQPDSGPAGSVVQVTASGFGAGVPVQVGIGELDTEPTRTFDLTTNDSGMLTTELTIPQSAAAGSRWNVIVGSDGWRLKARSENFTVTGDTQGGGDDSNRFTSAQIYLIALEDGGASGAEIGCGDSVVPVEVNFDSTVAPLGAALDQLLAIDERMVGQSGLYNALYNSNLSVDSIDIQNRTAIINLSGDLSIGGVCDEPRVEAQISQTALQFGTIDDVVIRINGESLR